MNRVSSVLLVLGLASVGVSAFAGGANDLLKPQVNRQTISVPSRADEGDPGRVCECYQGKWVCNPPGGLHGSKCWTSEPTSVDLLNRDRTITPLVLPGDQFTTKDPSLSTQPLRR